jgi:hypothetical protein
VAEFWTLGGIWLLMTIIFEALVIAALTFVVFFFLEWKLLASQRVLPFVPIALTVLLVVWTAVVSPFSKYGDDWAINPAIALAPIVIAWHLSLLGIRLGRWTCRREIVVFYGIYGVVHLCVFAVIWLVCLMRISKDCL